MNRIELGSFGYAGSHISKFAKQLVSVLNFFKSMTNSMLEENEIRQCFLSLMNTGGVPLFSARK